VPINPAGNLNRAVFKALAEGEPVVLPNLGLETLQHVHADDVAQAFMLALANRSVSVGESFHAVAAGAMTLRGFAEAVAALHGKDAKLSFLPWDRWKETVSERDAHATYDHIAHSPHCSIEKAVRLLGFRPRYSGIEAVAESIAPF
jgi:nucleoside-diphosphate-sugar epimerase